MGAGAREAWGGADARRGIHTYRMGAHTTADDPTKYRGRDEDAAWRERDPIDRVVVHLRSIDEIDDAYLAELEREADDLGADTRAAIAQLRNVTMEELFEHCYAEPTAELAEQQREFARVATDCEVA